MKRHALSALGLHVNMIEGYARRRKNTGAHLKWIFVFGNNGKINF